MDHQTFNSSKLIIDERSSLSKHSSQISSIQNIEELVQRQQEENQNEYHQDEEPQSNHLEDQDNDIPNFNEDENPNDEGNSDSSESSQSYSDEEISSYISDQDEGFEEAQACIVQLWKQSNRQNLFSIPNIEERGRKNKLIGPQLPTVEKSYSLLPDIVNGWRPKMLREHIPSPIALYFGDRDTVQVTNTIQNQYACAPNKAQIIYKGKKPKTSFELHGAFNGKYKNSFRFSNILFDEEILRQYRIEIRDQKLTDGQNSSLGMKDLNDLTSHNMIKEDNLKFDSFFEGGNLDLVVKISEKEYDLFLRPDTNTKGHQQWFHFTVSGCQKQQTIRFNICNFTHSRSLYQRGMKPYFLSKHEASQQQSPWKQGGTSISYQKRKNRLYDNNQDSRKAYYQLSFDFEFQHENDTISFAAQPPFSYSEMKDLFVSEEISQCKEFFRETKLCRSLSGLIIPLIEISDFTSEGISSIPLKQRKIIIISARIHPGEAVSSHVAIGVLKGLLFNEDFTAIRRKIIFKIIPMLNADGVTVGNSRSGFSGLDFNRDFGNKDNDLLPEVQYLKRLVRRDQKSGNLLGFIDIHSNPTRRNSSISGPLFSREEFNFFRARLLPLKIAENCEYFRFKACKYTNQRDNKKDSLAQFFHKTLGVFNSFKFEVSAGLAGIGKCGNVKLLGLEDYYQIGEDLVKSLGQLEEYSRYMSVVKNKIESVQQRQEQEKAIMLAAKEEAEEEAKKINHHYIPAKTNLGGSLAASISKTKSNLQSQLPPEEESFTAIKMAIKQINERECRRDGNDSDKYPENRQDSDESDEDYEDESLKAIHEEIRFSLANFKKQFTKPVEPTSNPSTNPATIQPGIKKELIILLNQPKDNAERKKRYRKLKLKEATCSRHNSKLSKAYLRKFMDSDLQQIFGNLIRGEQEQYFKSQRIISKSLKKDEQYTIQASRTLSIANRDKKSSEKVPDNNNNKSMKTTSTAFALSIAPKFNILPTQVQQPQQNSYSSNFKQESSYTFQSIPLQRPILEDNNNFLQPRRRSLTPLKAHQQQQQQQQQLLPLKTQASYLISESDSKARNLDNQKYNPSPASKILLFQSASPVNLKERQQSYFVKEQQTQKHMQFSNISTKKQSYQEPLQLSMQYPLKLSSDPFGNTFTSNFNAILQNNTNHHNAYIPLSKNNYNSCKSNNNNSTHSHSDSKNSNFISAKSNSKRNRDASFDLAVRPFSILHSPQNFNLEDNYNNENQAPYSTSLPFKAYQSRKNNLSFSHHSQRSKPTPSSTACSSFLI